MESVKLVPINPLLWEEYLEIRTLREGVEPQLLPARSGLWIVSSAGQLIAGVCLYPTDVNFVLVEGLAVSWRFHLRLRHRAVLKLAEQVRVYSAAVNKVPMCYVPPGGLGRVIRRAGWQQLPGKMYWSKNQGGFKLEPLRRQT
jgi:hypothetical protein